jgi:hypothetical protein
MRAAAREARERRLASLHQTRSRVIPEGSTFTVHMCPPVRLPEHLSQGNVCLHIFEAEHPAAKSVRAQSPRSLHSRSTPVIHPYLIICISSRNLSINLLKGCRNHFILIILTVPFLSPQGRSRIALFQIRRYILRPEGRSRGASILWLAPFSGTQDPVLIAPEPEARPCPSAGWS